MILIFISTNIIASLCPPNGLRRVGLIKGRVRSFVLKHMGETKMSPKHNNKYMINNRNNIKLLQATKRN